MDRKHQVFVSSTYKDLVDERKEVIHALLELDCIPAGMELFPATDEDAWSLIKEIIDGCDYYLLILSGRYGSVNNDGAGYTEMEYDYAVNSNKPIMTFLHENIDELISSHIEKTDKGKKRLEKFREKALLKHCKYFNSPEDLGGKVSRSLVQLKKKHPSEGWVPGKYAADEKMLREMEALRAKVAELEIQALITSDTPPPDIENLSQGNDRYYAHLELHANSDDKTKPVAISLSWDKIFSYCGSSLVGECDDAELLRKIQLAFWHSVPDEYEKFNSNANIIIPYVVSDEIKVQLQAL